MLGQAPLLCAREAGALLTDGQLSQDLFSNVKTPQGIGVGSSWKSKHAQGCGYAFPTAFLTFSQHNMNTSNGRSQTQIIKF